MIDVNATETKAILNAAVASTQFVDDHDGIPYVVIPDGYRLQDIEHLMETPQRKRGNVIVHTAGGIIEYVNKHKIDGATIIYASVDLDAAKCQLVAVLNDHHSAGPLWRDHRCTFAPKPSVEWKRWIQKNKAQFTQAEFASFLEDNLADIAPADGMPSGSDILQMCLAFEATADKRLRSKINMQSGGVQFEYVDDEDKDTRTRMQVFRSFMVGIPVFEGATSGYKMEARLKYRERDGKLTFWYELIREDRVFRAAVNDMLAVIVNGTGVPIIYGTPE